MRANSPTLLIFREDYRIVKFVARFLRLGPDRTDRPFGPTCGEADANSFSVPELRGNSPTLLIFHVDYKNVQFVATFLRLGPERPPRPSCLLKVRPTRTFSLSRNCVETHPPLSFFMRITETVCFWRASSVWDLNGRIGHMGLLEVRRTRTFSLSRT